MTIWNKKRRAFLPLFLATFLSLSALGQTTVILAPVFKQQLFDQAGRPLAFGCVSTFESGTTTPLGTYTDSTGATLNTNPVILSAGGSANIWLKAGQSYSIRVKSSGGTQCASGTTQYTVDGVGGGASVLTTNVAFSTNPTFVDVAQVQLFTFTLTGNAVSLPLSVVGVTPPGIIIWQITQDSSGAHTFTWPANVVGGAPIGLAANQVTTQMFIWNGTDATAIGPAVTGTGPSLSADTLALATSISIGGGSPLLTSNTSGSGSICLTTGCTLTTPTITNPTVTTGSFSTPTITSPVINGTPVLGQVVNTICADGTTTSVNANVTSQQPIKTCLLGTATLNTIGKSIRLTTSQDANPASGAMVHSLSWGFGATTALGTYIAQASVNSGTDTAVTGTLTCTTVTTGATGTLSCVQMGQTDSGSTIGLSPYQTTVTLDLTGAIVVGQACAFASGSVANVCTSKLLTVEQMK